MSAATFSAASILALAPGASFFARLLHWLISLGVRVEEAGLERAEKGLASNRLLLRLV